MNEIFIIDHSTTPLEAKGHKGGNGKRGGDLLYRWGNPANYGRGTKADKKLFGQHDVRWITKGKPGEGNLLIFNNEVDNSKGNYSSILEITPPLSGKTYSLEKQGAFLPTQTSWQYIANDTISFFAPFISSSQRLENGNTLINCGPRGQFFEVNPQNQIIWEYWSKYCDERFDTQSERIQPVGPFIFSTFRATHISEDHPFILSKNLEPIQPQPRYYPFHTNPFYKNGLERYRSILK